MAELATVLSSMIVRSSRSMESPLVPFETDAVGGGRVGVVHRVAT